MPDEIHSPYDGFANRSVDLGSYVIYVRANGIEEQCESNSILQLLPKPRLTITATLDSGEFPFLHSVDQAKIRYDGVRNWYTTIVIGARFGQQGSDPAQMSVTLLPNPEHIIIRTPHKHMYTSVIFHLINFDPFLCTGGGESDLRIVRGTSTRRLGRVALVYDGWEVEVQELYQTKEVVNELKQSGGYGITHVGLVKRENGRAFTLKDVRHVFAYLRLFLSFAKGSWTPICLITGIDRSGNTILREWGMQPVAAWGYRKSWFDRHHGEALADLYPGFIRLLDDATLRSSVSRALHWYAHSNQGTDGAGIEGSIILSHAALDSLASAFLDKNGIKVPKGSDNAASRLRTMCGHRLMGIPTRIPKTSRNAHKARAAGAWIDIPDAINKSRNDLVHHAKKLSVQSTRFEVWQLAQWYIELCILRLSGYTGTYSNRLHVNWLGSVEKVPWAK